MSDLTLCPGRPCPLRNRCYRFRAKVYGRYDAFGTPPYDPQTGTCAYFMDVAARTPTDDDVRRRAYDIWLAEGRPEGRADAHWARAHAELTQSFRGELCPPDEG